MTALGTLNGYYLTGSLDELTEIKNYNDELTTIHINGRTNLSIIYELLKVNSSITELILEYPIVDPTNIILQIASLIKKIYILYECDGVELLIEHLPKSKVASLTFSSTNITEQQFILLANILPRTIIQSLKFHSVSFYDNAIGYLITMLPRSNLTRLDMVSISICRTSEFKSHCSFCWVSRSVCTEFNQEQFPDLTKALYDAIVISNIDTIRITDPYFCQAFCNVLLKLKRLSLGTKLFSHQYLNKADAYLLLDWIAASNITCLNLSGIRLGNANGTDVCGEEANSWAQSLLKMLPHTGITNLKLCGLVGDQIIIDNLKYLMNGSLKHLSLSCKCFDETLDAIALELESNYILCSLAMPNKHAKINSLLKRNVEQAFKNRFSKTKCVTNT